MMYTMMVNGRRVTVREGVRPGWHLIVNGAYWGAYESPLQALEAAIHVIQTPTFH